MPNCENVMGHSENNRDLVSSLVRRSSDAFAAAVAPYAKKEVEPLGYAFVPSLASPLNANLHSLPHFEGVVAKTIEEVSRFESRLRDTKRVCRRRV